MGTVCPSCQNEFADKHSAASCNRKCFDRGLTRHFRLNVPISLTFESLRERGGGMIFRPKPPAQDTLYIEKGYRFISYDCLRFNCWDVCDMARGRYFFRVSVMKHYATDLEITIRPPIWQLNAVMLVNQ